MGGEQSTVAAIELFSDKLPTSPKAGSLAFYPLHITSINFVEDTRRKHHGEQKTARLLPSDV